MPAFADQFSDFVLSSFLETNTLNDMPSLFEQEIITTSTNTCFSPICSHEYLQDIPGHAQIHETSLLEGSSIAKQGTNSSSMVAELECGDQVSRVVSPVEKKRKNTDMKVERESKGENQRRQSGTLKNTEERRIKPVAKKLKKVPETPPTDYVHVRARRGQATDSHSLAERARREKISVRMKLLQSLVPGCDKITGKALVLDEIIKYVQSLQSHVEFLATKLSSVDSSTSTLASEELFSLEAVPMTCVQDSSSTQLTSFHETTTPASTSLLLLQEQRSKITFQENSNVLWGTEKQRQNLVKQFGFDNICSFW